MNDFMSERRNEAFVAVEGFARRHVNAILVGAIICVPRAIVDSNADAFEKQFRGGDSLSDRPCVRLRAFGRAVNLRLVEDNKAPSKEAGAAFLAIGIRRGGFVTLLLFPQNDVRTGFTAADLCADVSPLTVGRPSAGLKTVSFGRRPKDETVDAGIRSEEHTSELQSLMRISYAVFCLKK